MYLHIWGKTNHSLVDVLYLVQQAIKAWRHVSIVAVLPSQVRDQPWQMVVKQLNALCSQPVKHPQ